MRFGGVVQQARGRILPNGLLLASEVLALGIERQVTDLVGLPPTDDPYVQVALLSNAFDKVRTWLQVDDWSLVPNVHFLVGASPVDTVGSIAATLSKLDYRVGVTGTTLFIRAPRPEQSLNVSAPYNWGPPVFAVNPLGEVVAAPSPPAQQVFAR